MLIGLCRLLEQITWPEPVYADDTPPDSSLTMSRRLVSLAGVEGQTVYQLPDSFIIAHTDRVEAKGRAFVRDVDYRIDSQHGLLTLTQPVPPDTPLLIQYERFPLPLQRQYAHRPLVIERVLADSIPSSAGLTRTTSDRVSGRNAPFSGFPSALTAGGSKTFGVTVGSNRDASLEQSLRIQISGKAARDVEVVAILSDQSNPIQPEGNTQTLQELDQVLVQVKTPHATTTMGDYTMTLDKTAFARYDRKLKGAQGALQFPNGTFTLSAAVSEGKFTTNAFQGGEGNQGPYPLTGPDGVQAITVIAGTEKVWIDGVRMTRGEDNDYTIEYASAQVT
ncbi:MAG: hypothetical protein HY710_13725, partial [Candidatus Latescibacteria bacterium]|nr:hypothetical protein [Candidatus Latescibacterota bacterium]